MLRERTHKSIKLIKLIHLSHYWGLQIDVKMLWCNVNCEVAQATKHRGTSEEGSNCWTVQHCCVYAAEGREIGNRGLRIDCWKFCKWSLYTEPWPDAGAVRTFDTACCCIAVGRSYKCKAVDDPIGTLFFFFYNEFMPGLATG